MLYTEKDVILHTGSKAYIQFIRISNYILVVALTFLQRFAATFFIMHRRKMSQQNPILGCIIFAIFAFVHSRGVIIAGIFFAQISFITPFPRHQFVNLLAGIVLLPEKGNIL